MVFFCCVFANRRWWYEPNKSVIYRQLHLLTQISNHTSSSPFNHFQAILSLWPTHRFNMLNSRYILVTTSCSQNYHTKLLIVFFCKSISMVPFPFKKNIARNADFPAEHWFAVSLSRISLKAPLGGLVRCTRGCLIPLIKFTAYVTMETGDKFSHSTDTCFTLKSVDFGLALQELLLGFSLCCRGKKT